MTKYLMCMSQKISQNYELYKPMFWSEDYFDSQISNFKVIEEFVGSGKIVYIGQNLIELRAQIKDH